MCAIASQLQLRASLTSEAALPRAASGWDAGAKHSLVHQDVHLAPRERAQRVLQQGRLVHVGNVTRVRANAPGEARGLRQGEGMENCLVLHARRAHFAHEAS